MGFSPGALNAPAAEAPEDPDYLSRQIITYIGNKRSLLPFIGRGLDHARQALGRERISFLDLFSGSGIVARYARQFAHTLHANDLEDYSTLLNRCYLANASEVNWPALREAVAAIKAEAAHGLREGFITRLYAPQNEADIKPGERVFYTRRNAMYLDTCRQLVARQPAGLQPFLLGPLLAAASVHANTSGVFKGFYKNRQGVGQFGGTGRNALARILKPIELELPVLSRQSCVCTLTQMDANEYVKSMPEVDVAYLDPPYNQHPYGSNYFMLNLLARYEEPTGLSAVSGIPEGWNRSSYNKRGKARQALFEVVEACRARFVLISYNSEGFIGQDDFVAELQRYGAVSVMDTAYNTFRGCRNLRNRDIHVTEFLYLVDKQGKS